MAEIGTCILGVLNKMDSEEKGMLKCILDFGKNIQKKGAEIINSTNELKKYGENVTSEQIINQLGNIFQEGIGIGDKLINISHDYGKQLDFVITKILVRSLKVKKPFFSKDIKSVDGAIQREQWIAEKLMDSLILAMDEDAKKEFITQLAQILEDKGINPTQITEATSAILTGGLTAVRTILGFQFHIIVAQVANLITRILIGRGLTFAANAALQRVVGLLFGPIGWVIMGITTFPLITSLVNPREYDKYIPAIFIIGITRMSQNAKQERDIILSNN